MIHRSELSGLIKKKGTRTGLKMSEKAANAQIKTLKDIQKALRTVAQDHFKRLKESLAAWKKISRKEEKIRTFV